jgi:hypothetical protein
MRIKRKKEAFKFEVTDTFGGEANYCWRREFTLEAVSLHGALCMLSRKTGFNFRSVGADRFDALGACVCAFHLDW